MFFTASSSLFLPLGKMIYEVVEEGQEGEDTTGDGDDDEWGNRNVFRSNKQTPCKLARMTHNNSHPSRQPRAWIKSRQLNLACSLIGPLTLYTRTV